MSTRTGKLSSLVWSGLVRDESDESGQGSAMDKNQDHRTVTRVGDGEEGDEERPVVSVEDRGFARALLIAV